MSCTSRFFSTIHFDTYFVIDLSTGGGILAPGGGQASSLYTIMRFVILSLVMFQTM
jgi:hypothetical protein